MIKFKNQVVPDSGIFKLQQVDTCYEVAIKNLWLFFYLFLLNIFDANRT